MNAKSGNMLEAKMPVSGFYNQTNILQIMSKERHLITIARITYCVTNLKNCIFNKKFGEMCSASGGVFTSDRQTLWSVY